MTNHLRVIAIVVVALVAPFGAEAQEQTLRLTLEDVIARAEKNSHRIAGLEARVDVAAASLAARDSADRPTVALLGGYTRTNHVEEFSLPLRVLYPDVPDNYRSRLDLQWPIYSGGRTAALERAAAAERNAAQSDVLAARADLRLEAVRAFWALVTARHTEEVVRRALDSIDAHVADLRARLEQGLIPPNDVLSAEAQRSRQRLLAIEAANRRGIAEADIRRLIGADGQSPIAPAASLLPPEGEHGPSSLKAAIEQRHERRALSSRVDAATERETAAEASAKPQVGVGAGFDYARPNPRIFPRTDEWHDSWDVSVNVSWTLWDGGRRRAEEAEAAATTRVLTSRVSEFDRDLAFEIEQRRLDADSAQAAIATAEDGVRAALEARRVLGERFNAGVATSTEVLEAQTAVLHAELDRTLAIANAWLARARLDRAMGRI